MLSFITIRESRWTKRFALFLLINFFAEWIAPFAMFALTTGPSQEEFTSFTPFDSSNLVDPYTGKLNYNIPLMVVPGPNGGYPINLGYSAGIGMDQEASWVGLGWNLNVGAINRQLRGIPDDFKGEVLKEKKELRTQRTFTWDLARSLTPSNEILGFETTGTPFNLGLSYSNYYGASYNLGFNISLGNTGLGLGLDYDSQSGLDVGASYSLSGSLLPEKLKKSTQASLNGQFGFNVGMNSRSGFQAMSINTGVNNSKANQDGELETTSGGGFGAKSSISFGSGYNFPTTSKIPMVYKTKDVDIKIGGATFPNFSTPFPVKGSIVEYEVANGGLLNTNTFGFLYTQDAGQEDQKDFQKTGYHLSKKIPNLPPSTFTYDLYSLSGQGLGGQFRAHRTDIGLLSEPLRKDKIEGSKFNPELGLGAFGHVGYSFVNTDGEIKSGAWKEAESAIDGLNFEDDVNNRNPYYFKMVGEKTTIDKDQHQLYQNWGGEEAYRIKIKKENEDFIVNLNSANDYGYEARETTDNTTVNTSCESTTININADEYKQLPESNYLNAYQIQGLTVKEAMEYQVPNFSRPFFNMINRDGDDGNQSYLWLAPDHHTGQFNVTNLEGTTYEYGKPLYNKEQIDVAFSCLPPGVTEPDNSYDIFNTEQSLKEDKVDAAQEGIDRTRPKQFSKSEIAPYVHSWLLTAVYSADYVDKTGDGPSNDDLGYWVKFTYSDNEDHAWRTPLDGAHYNTGNYIDPHDDMGTFTYGSKQVSYLTEIETKTHRAKFITSPREDGLSALGEGGTGTFQEDLDAPYIDADEYENNKINLELGNGIKQPKKLDRIELHLKSNLNTAPLQTTHFEYDYELCPNVVNNTRSAVNDDNGNDLNANKGKLTLKKVWTTFNGSSKGKQTPYQFTYSNNNPEYIIQNYDRWGGHKKNLESPDDPSIDHYPYKEFPYTEQHVKSTVDNWCLTEILTPTGSKLKIEYEANDYAYVEDKRAMQMFDIVSIGSPPTLNDLGGSAAVAAENDEDFFMNYREEFEEGKPQKGNIDNHPEDGYRIYFLLPRKISTDQIANHVYDDPDLTQEGKEDSYVKEFFVNGIEDIYYKAFVGLRPEGADLELSCATNNGDFKDFIAAYARIDQGDGTCGLKDIDGNQTYDVGFVTLENERIKDLFKINPIQKAAFQHMKINQPQAISNIDFLCQNGTNIGDSVDEFFEDAFTGIVDIVDELSLMIAGYQIYMKGKEWADYIDLNGRSKIRLQNPEGIKYASTARVKRVLVTDNQWENNSDTESIEYGQEYLYETEENGHAISSGVAYEPLIGGEENALKQPISYTQSAPLKSPLNLFLEEPLMQNYYPGAQIGYSKVIVKSINATENKYQATPYTCYEFNTAKDFPIKFKDTGITKNTPISRKSPPIPGFSKSYRQMGFSQGYSLTLNDMAGKPKTVSQRTFPNIEGVDAQEEEAMENTAMIQGRGQLISQETYEYFTQNGNEVQSEIPILKKGDNDDYAYKTGVSGLSYDIFLDTHEVNQSSNKGGFDGNLDFSPFPIPGIYPQKNKNTEIVRTIVTNKIIYKRGILKSKTIKDQAAEITTTNLAFDPLTGESILTKVDNEFKDPLYSMQYPAHWYYDEGLGLADKNMGLSFSDLSLTNGTIDNLTSTDVFVSGDKIWLSGDSESFPAWVTEVGATDITCIDEIGEKPTMVGNNVTLTIIKSGRKNIPGLKAGSIAMKQINSAFEEFAEDIDCVGGSFSIDNSDDNLNEVINASAVTFKDTYPVFCTEEVVEHAPTDTECTEYESPGEYPYLIEDFMKETSNCFRSVATWYSGGGEASDLVSIGCSLDSNNESTYSLNDFIHTTASSVSYDEGHPNDESFFEFEYCGCDIKFERDDDNNLDNDDLWEMLITDEADSGSTGCWYFDITNTPSIDNVNGEWIGSFTANFRFIPGPYNPVSFTVTYDAGPDCWKGTCLNDIEPSEEIVIEDCGPSMNETVNPYKEGLKGKWRVDQTFFYDSNREYKTSVNTNGEMAFDDNTWNGARQDGLLDNFEEFDWSDSDNALDNWHDATTITKYSPFGFELEEKNSLGIYSAALYGYNHSLNTAVGANTTYNEMGFDGFEDYLLTMDMSEDALSYSDPYNCNPTQSHFKFVKEEGETVTALQECDGDTQCLSTDEAHTGKYSLFLAADEEYVSMTKDVENSNCSNNFTECIDSDGDTQVEECDCIGWFVPKACEKYHISAWVKEAGVSSGFLRYEAPTITIGFDGVPNAEDFNFKTEVGSSIIEGWQQIKGDFEVPQEANNITISLVNNSEGAINDGIYFDDIRIHPYNSNIKTFVYHPDHLRLVAELDENNFATFYIHDEEGQLIKVKKETERGIKTIEEGRSYVRYSNEP